MAFTTAEVESLAHMLDKNAGFKRPETQSTGYSNDEPPEGDGRTLTTGPTAGPSACAPLPSTVIDKTIGLPVPSQTKEGLLLRKQQTVETRPKPRGNDIWCSEEIPSSSAGSAAPTDKSVSTQSNSANDGKQVPEYEVLYKQFLNAEDVYLGVDFTKNGSSALCEGVVVKVQLPRVAAANEITLEVEPFILILTSPQYKLRAPLPIKVVEKKAAAKWDAAKKLLSVTLTTDLSEREVKLM